MGQYTKVTVARQSFFQMVANQESHSGDLRIWRGNLPESSGSTATDPRRVSAINFTRYSLRDKGSVGIMNKRCKV